MVILIEDAKPGMKLLEDVLLPNGSILVNAEQCLTESLIDTLLRRNIKKIQIVTAEEAVQSQVIVPEPIKPAINETKIESAAPLNTPVASTQPILRVVIKDDKMSAKLCVEPTESPNQELERDHLLTAILEAGIIVGVNEEAITAVLEKWKKYKRYYEINDIAKGTPPKPGKESGLDFKVKHLESSSEIDLVKKARFYAEIPKEALVDRVDKGTVIAVRQDTIPPCPGESVLGDIVTSSEIVKSDFSFDSNVSISDDKKRILAEATGFAFFIDGRNIGIIQFNFNGSAEMVISPDKMQAQVLVHPPGPNGKAPTKEAIANLLLDNKVSYGVKNDVLEKLYNDFATNVFPLEPVVIAEGLWAKNGANGSIKYLFNTESSLKPKVNPDGSADFKNIDIVISASKDQKLAELVPPEKGVCGKDVYGKELPCIDGSPAKLPIGTNTLVSPESPSILIAGTDGNVRCSGSVVEISEGFIVNGNVDFSTGNIKYPKSVVVSGDIKSGFKVECGGDLQVSGTIEDSDIAVNGNVLCKLGFVGQGKGIISAKGDVNLAFMKNQVVKCRQNIVIAKEALNCTIFARKTITVHGKPLSIAGGKIMARDEITAYTIGNMSGIKTLVEVGTDFTLIEEMEKTDAQINELNENRSKLLVTYHKYEKIKELKKSLNPKEDLMFTKLKETLSKYEQQIKTLEERKKIILTKMHNFKTSFIKIEHSAMPGTMFKFGTRHFLVKEEIIGPKAIRVINEEIRVL